MSKIIKNGIVYGETLLPAAGNIAYDNTASGLNATTMQNAITELKDMYDLPKGYAWAGTQAQWDALTVSEKAVYDDKIIAIIGDDEIDAYTETTLYSGGTASDTEYDLTDSIANYDEIHIISTNVQNTYNYYVVNTFSASELLAHVGTTDMFAITADLWYSYFSVETASKFIKKDTQQLYISKIIGIKYSSGGGSGSGEGSTIIDYSTTEQNTSRKWIDGKPIYQKTFNTNVQLYNDLVYVPVTSSLDNLDIDNLIDYSIIGIDNYSTNYHKGVLTGVFVKLVPESGLNVYLLSDWSFLVTNVTIWYTKTTDTAE